MAKDWPYAKLVKWASEHGGPEAALIADMEATVKNEPAEEKPGNQVGEESEK